MSQQDRTLYAVTRQVKALAADLFEVGIRNQKTGEMMLREWGRTQFSQNNVNWLKRQNANNEDIYIRPKRTEQGCLVLVDDLEGMDVEQMREDGIQPAAVVETSPKNLQVWIKLNLDTDYRTRTEIARFIAEDYQGDKNSADAHHFGRLAGFTNRKPEYVGSKGFPFVLLRESRGVECGQSQALIDRAGRRWEARQRLDMPRFIRDEMARNEGVADYSELYQNVRQSYLHKVGLDDLSRIDWAVGNILYQRKRDREQVAQALANTSPELAERKKGHLDEYLLRTTIKIELFNTNFAGQHYLEVQHELSRLTAAKMQEIKGGTCKTSRPGGDPDRDKPEDKD